MTVSSAYFCELATEHGFPCSPSHWSALCRFFGRLPRSLLSPFRPQTASDPGGGGGHVYSQWDPPPPPRDPMFPYSLILHLILHLQSICLLVSLKSTMRGHFDPFHFCSAAPQQVTKLLPYIYILNR